MPLIFCDSRLSWIIVTNNHVYNFVYNRIRLLAVRLFSKNSQRNCKPRGLGVTPSFIAAPLACLGFACSNFAKKNKRLRVVCWAGLIVCRHSSIICASTFTNVFAWHSTLNLTSILCSALYSDFKLADTKLDNSENYLVRLGKNLSCRARS